MTGQTAVFNVFIIMLQRVNVSMFLSAGNQILPVMEPDRARAEPVINLSSTPLGGNIPDLLELMWNK